MDQNTSAGGCSSETQVPLLQLSLMDSYLTLENKMDPLGSDPINVDECFGFSQELINHPSEQKNGCVNLNSQSTDCGAPNSQTEEGEAQQQQKDVNTDVQDEFWLTDGTPYFHCILSKSHLRNPYQLVMPAKMQRILPDKEVPVVLACGNKSWKMTYYGDHPSHKRLDTKWRQFVVDNNLKIGDGCVFELLECSEALIKFRVKILSGDFPAELLDRFGGLCSKNPIVLD